MGVEPRKNQLCIVAANCYVFIELSVSISNFGLCNDGTGVYGVDLWFELGKWGHLGKVKISCGKMAEEIGDGVNS